MNQRPPTSSHCCCCHRVSCHCRAVLLGIGVMMMMLWSSSQAEQFSTAKMSRLAPPSSTRRRQQQRLVGRTLSDRSSKDQLVETLAPPDVAAASPTATTTATTATTTATRGGSSSVSNPHDNTKIMLLIRLLFLAYYGSLGSLLPYLPVYYHSLGHGGQIIGILGALKPFTTFLVAPLWGIIADQSQQPFVILQVTFVVSLVGQLLVCFRHDALYLSITVFWTALFNAPVKSLIDSMVMDHLTDQSKYGRLRLWGQLGFGIGSSAVGMLLSRYSKHVPWHDATSSLTESFLQQFPKPLRWVLPWADKFWTSLTGYKLLFVAHALLSIPTWFCITAFRKMDAEQQERRVATKNAKQQQQKTEGNKITEGLWLLLQNGDALLFFFLVFVVGVSSGVIENFAYVRMREVGGSGKEMGLSRLVSSIAGAPMFWFSGPLTQALGADRVIVLSLASYVVRFLIYALMRNPYHGLPAEALRGVTFAAFWSTGTVYAHKVSPPGLHATMLMFLNAMYGGLGQSLGAIIGGKLQHRFGTVQTFLYSAAFDFCFTGLVIVYLAIRKDSSFKDPKPIVARDRKHLVEVDLPEDDANTTKKEL